MAVPSHIKIVFRGVFSGTPETWSFGQHYRSDVTGSPDAEASDVHLDQCATAFDTWLHVAQAQFPSSAKLTDIRAYKIGTDGRMEGDPNILDVTTLNIGGASSVIYPPQICLVMTHVAEHRGPARFGRNFIPTSAAVGADFRVAAATCDNIMAQWVGFLKDVSDCVDLEGGESSDMLNISASGVGGAKQVVDHVEVGRALDTLRSRRRSLLEERRIGGHIDW